MNSTTETEETTPMKAQALVELDRIKAQVARWKAALMTSNHSASAVMAEIEADVTVDVRADWRAPDSDERCEPVEYCIGVYYKPETGGRAEVTGLLELGLDKAYHPSAALLRYKTTGAPWRDLKVSNADAAALLEYTRLFYFEEQGSNH